MFLLGMFLPKNVWISLHSLSDAGIVWSLFVMNICETSAEDAHCLSTALNLYKMTILAFHFYFLLNNANDTYSFFCFGFTTDGLILFALRDQDITRIAIADFAIHSLFF